MLLTNSVILGSPFNALKCCFVAIKLLIIFHTAHYFTITTIEASRLESKTFVLKSEIEHGHEQTDELNSPGLIRIQLTERYSHEQARGLVASTVVNILNENDSGEQKQEHEPEQRGSYWVDKNEKLLLFQSPSKGTEQATTTKCTRLKNAQKVWQDIGLDIVSGVPPSKGLYIGPARLMDYLADKLGESSKSIKRVDGETLDLFGELKAVASDWSNQALASDQPLPRLIKFTTSDGHWASVKFVSLEEVETVTTTTTTDKTGTSTSTNALSWDPFAIEPLSSCSLLLAKTANNVDYNRLSPFTRRVAAHKSSQRFMFEAKIKASNPNVKLIKAKVAYDARLQKLRTDFVIPEAKQTMLQAFDLSSDIVFHKIALGDKRIIRNSCGASLIPTGVLLNIGKLFMGSDSAQYLGLARIQDGGSSRLARVYQSIGTGLPFWLDQQLESELSTVYKKTTTYLILLYFSVTDGIDDKLLMTRVMRLAPDMKSVLDEQEITFERFDWSFNEGPEDPSNLLSIIRECPHAKAKRVSLSLEGRPLWKELEDVRERNLILLGGLQADLSLPLNRILNFISRASTQQQQQQQQQQKAPKIKMDAEFDVIPYIDAVGTLRPMMDKDEVYKKPKGTTKSIIENTLSLSHCYYSASQLSLDQVFFVYEPETRRCHLSGRIEKDWSKLTNDEKLKAVYTMRKVPHQYGAELETWPKPSLNRRLSLSAGSSCTSFAITRLAVDAIDAPTDSGGSSPDQPEIVEMTSVSSVMIYAFLSVVFIVAVIVIYHFREKLARRLSKDSTKELILFQQSGFVIEMDDIQSGEEELSDQN